MRRRMLHAVLLLCASCVATTQAGDGAAFDAEAAWRAFQSDPQGAKAYDGYALLDELGYDLHAVDADACRANADGLAQALRRAGPSVALHHAAMLCARATGDTAAADREGAALEALSRLALSQLPQQASGPPARVLATQDAYSLVAGMGLEPIYAYYRNLHPDRHMPFVLVAWDEEAGAERHLPFDMVAAMDSVIHADPYSGYPYQRTQLATAIAQEQAKHGETLGQDLVSLQAAIAAPARADKLGRLREGAAAGGIQSMANWMTLCESAPGDGCTDGMVDALLPAVEAHHALPMAQLAYAYAQGVGVERDPEAAASLLDAADRRWPRAGASTYFAAFWQMRHPADAPTPLVQARIDAARKAGNPDVENMVLARAAAADPPTLDQAGIEHLARPDNNPSGAGYALIAGYHLRRGEQAAAESWMRKAAEAGDATAMATLGMQLLRGEGVPADPARADVLLRDAAQGGSAIAARLLAYRAGSAGEWQEAMAWLLAPLSAGDIDALLDAAAIYEFERPGFEGEQARAVQIYEGLAKDASGAAARRRLAAMAIEGRGVPRSAVRAEALLREDAERDDAQSQGMLGEAYLSGRLGKADEASGRQWMERAMRAQSPEAFASYGLWLVKSKDTPESRREGLALLQRGAELPSADMAINNLAWVRCTSPRDDVRDPRLGQALAARLAAVAGIDAGVRDTVAACHAADGRFEEAARLQAGVVEEFERRAQRSGAGEREAMGETLQRARGRLADYQAGKAHFEQPDAPQ